MSTQPFRKGARVSGMSADRRLVLLMGLAALFVAAGAVTLALAAPTPSLTTKHLLALFGGWVLSWGCGTALLRKRLPQGDLLLLPPVALLTGWGLLILARLAPGFLLRQVIWLPIGVAALCLIALLPTLPRVLRRYRYTLLIGGMLLLSATLVFGVNPSGAGARLWLGLPIGSGLYYQPSELLKLLLVIYLAAYLADRRGLTQDTDTLTPPSKAASRIWPTVLGPMLLMVGLALILVAWQEDLGAALLFYLTFLAMLYLAWGRAYHIAGGLLLFVPVMVAGGMLSSRVALRISIWLDPWAPEQADRAFQVLQSLFAMAAGGVFGEGLGLGRPTLIPAVHTDFVYAAVVDEFGAAGAIALLALLGLLVQRGLRLAQRCKSPFESLLAGGIAALIGIQTWVIVAGNAKLMPLTGVTLPFLSYGGSSLVTMMATVGLLLNLSAPHPLPLAITLPNEVALPSLKRTVSRLGLALLLLLGIAAAGTGSWTILQVETLRSYPTNSHRILSELRIQRGRIVDRRNTVLADITIDEAGFVERTYPVPAAAPVIGYATLQYGTDGIEATCDAALRGEAARTPWQADWDRLLHRDPIGQEVRLTLDARLQQEAIDLLTEYQGALVLVDAHTGEILALASSPTYDPTTVAETWATLRDDPAAPLLNRAAQGLAQPGAALETVLLSTVIEGQRAPSQPLNARIAVNGQTITCRITPDAEDWQAALSSACPGPFTTVGKTLGPEKLDTLFTAWGLTRAPHLEIPAVAAPWDATESDPGQEAIGQGQLLVTPLQMVGVAATLGNRGERPPLHLLAEAQPGCTVDPATESVPVIDADLAASLRALWPHWGGSIGHLSTALAGPDRTLAWFLGLNSDSVPRYAVVVLLENPEQPEDAAVIGTRLLQQAVEP